MVLSVASLQEVNLTFDYLGYPGLLPPVPEVNCVGNRTVVFVLCVYCCVCVFVWLSVVSEFVWYVYVCVCMCMHVYVCVCK